MNVLRLVPTANSRCMHPGACKLLTGCHPSASAAKRHGRRPQISNKAPSDQTQAPCGADAPAWATRPLLAPCDRSEPLCFLLTRRTTSASVSRSWAVGIRRSLKTTTMTMMPVAIATMMQADSSLEARAPMLLDSVMRRALVTTTREEIWTKRKIWCRGRLGDFFMI